MAQTGSDEMVAPSNVSGSEKRRTLPTTPPETLTPQFQTHAVVANMVPSAHVADERDDMATLSGDSRQDVALWGRKRYRPRPLLCRSDGEIGLYRRYCEQFIRTG